MLSKAELENLYWKKKLCLREIGERYGKNQQTILNWMRRSGVPTRTRSEAAKLAYKKSERIRNALSTSTIIKPDLEPSLSLCYIIGVLLGDGYINVYKDNYRVGLQVKSRRFAEDFSRALGKVGLHPSIWVRKRGHYVVTATSKLFVEWFAKMSLSDIRTLISKKGSYAKAFIKGFYDSEGTTRGRMSNSKREIIQLVKSALENLGFHPRLYRYEAEDCRSGEMYELGVPKAERRSFYSMLSAIL